MSSAWPVPGATSGVALAHYELHAWCLLVLAWVFVPFYMRSMVFTMPEFLEKRFSAGSRYVLSIVSIVTFIVSKIAVGIFAGGVVFGTLLPEMHMTIGGIDIDSFWIGSVLVIVLTGLYTTLGGMRAVAYNDAVQAIILIIGSACLTFYGLHKLGGWHELQVHCRLRHVQPVEAADSRRRAGNMGAGAGNQCRRAGGEAGMVLQRELPLAGHAVLRADHRPVVLVHRPVHRAARTGRAKPDGSPPGQHFRCVPEAVPGLSVHHSRASSASRWPRAARFPSLTAIIGPDGHANAAAAQGSFPMMVQYLLPPGLRGIVVAGLLSALMGSLAGVFNACSTLFTVDLYEKWKPQATQAPTGASRPHCNWRDGAGRACCGFRSSRTRRGSTVICRRCRRTWRRRSSWCSFSASSISG